MTLFMVNWVLLSLSLYGMYRWGYSNGRREQ